MERATSVLILSDDALLRELMAELLRHDRIVVSDAATLERAAALCQTERPHVIVVDAVERPDLARELLDDPWTTLGDVQPGLVVLAGSATPPDVCGHGYVDRVLTAPLQSEVLVEALRYHASGRARRQMRSGVQLRATVAQTFATKRRVPGGD